MTDMFGIPTNIQRLPDGQITRLTPDRRPTIRQRSLLIRGIHPLMRTAVLKDGSTCGGCVHFRRSGDYFKCDLRHSFGPATDIRKSWPGCAKFEATK